MIAWLLALLEDVFSGLLTASWQASVLAVLVLAWQWTLGARLNPRWRYALWLLVLGRLLLPVQPESALSLFRFAPAPSAAFVAPMTEPLFAPLPTAAPVPAIAIATTEPQIAFSFYSVLALVWLAGVMILFILTWRVNGWFARQMAHSPEVRDPVLLGLFAAAKKELNISRSIRLVESGQVQSPAIMGLIQPTLLLPVRVREKFDENELRLIFLHELAHLKRGDVIAQALIALLQILHWFNPVLWLAFRRMRLDREPATDALVLSHAGEAEKERYGLMLIKLLEHFNQRHSLPTLVGILEDQDQFKRRFALIARFTRGAYGWSALGILLIGILSVACLTRSKASDSAAVIETANESDDKTAGLIRVAVKVVQIEDDDYQAHRGEIDGAVSKGDVTPLTNLRSFNLLAEALSLSKSGERSVMESVRVIPYPIAYQKDKNGKMTPTEFKRRDVGFRLPFSAATADGKINLTGDLEMTTFRGWITAADSAYEPIFNTRRLPFDKVALHSGQSAGLMVTNPSTDSSDPEAYFGPDEATRQPKRSTKLCRLFLFLNARVEPSAVLNSGTAHTKAEALTQPTDSAPSSSLVSTHPFPPTAAIVDGQPIREPEVEQQSAATEESLKNGAYGPAPAAQIAKLRQGVLDALIDRRLILNFKNRDGEIPKEFIDDRVNDEIKERYGGNRAVFLQTLAARKESLAGFRQEIADNAIIQLTRTQNVTEKSKRYYQDHLDLFPADEQINITLLTIPVPAVQGGDKEKQRQAAEQALDQLRKGADVWTVTKGFASPLDLGNGWITKDGVCSLAGHPEIWQAVENVKTGQLSGVIETPFFFAVARVNERRPATAPSTEKTEHDKNLILDAEGDRLKKEWLGSLRAKASIQYFSPYHDVGTDTVGAGQAMPPDTVTTPVPSAAKLATAGLSSPGPIQSIPPTTVVMNAPVGAAPGAPQNVSGQSPASNPSQIRISVVVTGKNLKDWPHLSNFDGLKMNVPTVSRLDLGTATILGGGTGSVASVFKFPYPSNFDPAERVQEDDSAGKKMTVVIPMTPTEFVTTMVGWSVALQPTVENGQIHLQGTATYTDAEMHHGGVYGDPSGPIYGDVKDPKTGKTLHVLVSANSANMPAFTKSETPFFVFCQPGRDYTVRLPYGSDWVDATIHCDLVPVADVTKPAVDAVAGMLVPNPIQSANSLMNHDSLVAPPVKGPGVEITGKLKEPGQVDFSRSSGLLLSPDGVGYKFGFAADGSFTIPRVQPGIYNRYLQLVSKSDSVTWPVSSSPALDPVTVEAGSAHLTMNIAMDNPFDRPLAAGQVEIELKVAAVDEDDYDAHREVFDAAMKKGGPEMVSLLLNRKSVDLISTPSVTAEAGKVAHIDIVREFPYPTAFTTDKNGKVTPDSFTTADVGIKSDVIAKRENGKIQLNCALSITDFDGFTESNMGVQLPTFHTVESHAVDEMASGELKGVWIPGNLFRKQTVHTNGAPASSDVHRIVPQRILLMLSARDT